MSLGTSVKASNFFPTSFAFLKIEAKSNVILSGLGPSTILHLTTLSSPTQVLISQSKILKRLSKVDPIASTRSNAPPIAPESLDNALLTPLNTPFINPLNCPKS